MVSSDEYHTSDRTADLRAGRVLGIELTHSYAHTNDTYNFLPNSLKGADMSLLNTAEALGLKCKLVPVMEHEHYGDGGDVVVRLYKNSFEMMRDGGDYEGFLLDEENYTRWGEKLPKGQITWLWHGNSGESEAQVIHPTVTFRDCLF
jgi:hypothetical protein